VHQPVQRKVVSPAALADIAQRLRAAGRTLVHCHGCFDVVHPGHLRYLQFARQLGDVLVVSLTGDGAISKGPDRPYIAQDLRAENVAALEFVDWVVVDPHPTACELLAQLRPDIYVKGREYAQATDPRFAREREIVERYGGRVAFHSGDVVFSSTRLLETLRADAQLDAQRLATLCRRNRIDAESVLRTVAGFAGARAVVVGDIVRERYIFCDTGVVADDAPVLASQQLGTAEYWGGAAGLGLQLAALGATTCVIGAAGRADSIPLLRRTGEGGGLTFSCRVLPERPSLIERTTFIADDAKLFKVTIGACVPLDSAAEKRAAAVLADELRRADLLVWCDQGFGMVTPGLLAAARKLVRQRRLFIGGCAAGPRAQLQGLTRTHLLSGTERQIREAMPEMAASLPAVVSNLVHATHGQTALVSLRKRGVIGFDARDAIRARSVSGGPESELDPAATAAWRQRLRNEFVPSLARHHVDLLGADGAVLAAGALALAGGSSLGLATYLAAATESLAASYSGGNPPNAAALQTMLDQRPELRADSGFVAQSTPHPETAEVAACALPD
jgi:rfaE bifunctional protein nucleotidyltransferase chain/domain